MVSEDDENQQEIDISMSELTNFDPVALSISYKFRPEIIQKLTLYGNNLNVVPASIVNFVHLRHLDVSSNQISWISGEISRLQLLRIIDARNNCLENLPKEFQDCSRLQTLNLSGNRFKEVPLHIFNIDGLRELFLGGNQIKSLPPQVQNLKQYVASYVYTYLRNFFCFIFLNIKY